MDGADAIKYILENNLEGAVIECGVFDGNMELIWIKELMQNNAVRDIYLYDTFNGMTTPCEFDFTAPDSKYFSMNKEELFRNWSAGKINEQTHSWCYAPLEKVKARLYATGYPPDHIHYIVGNVCETLKDKANIPNKIAILRLDTDWYESSKFELEQMYDHVVPGGVIVFDDYYHWEGQRKATDDFFKSRGLEYDFVDLKNHHVAAIIKK